MVLLGAMLACAACGDDLYRDLPYFQWDGERTIGAMSLDRLAPDDAALHAWIDSARDGDWVVMFYAHDPGNAVSTETLEAVFSHAQAAGLPFYTFAELVAGGPPRSGLCLSFDDTEVDGWFALRDLFAAYDVHATFFVTLYAQLSAEERAKLHTLYDEGHSIEAHGVNHANALDYIAAHGLAAYIDDEVVPSFDVLRADGFSPVAYAHPGGAHTRELDEALREHVALVRSISGRPRAH
jgi:hypothetical protein